MSLSAEEDTKSGGSPRVVYIVGVQNCGSTMLDAVIGAAPGVRSLGEVGGFHRYARADACDCGRRPATCDLCQAVLARLGCRAEPNGLERVLRRGQRERRIYWLWVPWGGRRGYERLSREMFRAVAEATGCTTVVDSSKSVTRAAALVTEGHLDVRVVHLVRDGRAFLRSRERRARHDGRRHRRVSAMATWLGKNLLVSVALRRLVPSGRFVECRLEDLVRDPEQALARIGEVTGLDLTESARAAVGPGVARSHLFEPARRYDYSAVRIDPARAAPPAVGRRANTAYWVLGGFLSRRWGYSRSPDAIRAPREPA